MFKFILVAALCLMAVCAEDAEIKSQHLDIDEHGFKYDYETSNHIRAEAVGDEHVIKGNFEWLSKEGDHIKVGYVADEYGYQPVSDVLPTPHPVPEAILKSIEYIRAHGGHE